MSNLIENVTPLTRGIIWLTKGLDNQSGAHYQSIDYLLNGLLTLNLKEASIKDHYLFVGNSFGQSLYILITDKVDASQIENLMTVLAAELKPETDILVVDELSEMGTLQKSAPENLVQKLKLL